MHTNKLKQRRKRGCDSVWGGRREALIEQMSFEPAARRETHSHGAHAGLSYPIHFLDLLGEELL